MDKFGIFNLLNSFFPLNSQNSQSSSGDQKASGLANTLISSLGKSLFNGESSNNIDVKNLAKETKVSAPPLPLQKNMLLTINSHDEFVKRVKEKNK